MNPSGIRLGSPAVTTRGFGEAEMREVGALIAEVLAPHRRRRRASPRCAQRVGVLTARFPLYAWKLDGAWRALRAARPMPLHIVIDARRMRDFGIGTYIRSLVHALAPSTRATGTRWSARPADVRSLAGLPPNFRLRGLRAHGLATRSITSRSRCFCAASRRTWCTFRSTACRC